MNKLFKMIFAFLGLAIIGITDGLGDNDWTQTVEGKKTFNQLSTEEAQKLEEADFNQYADALDFHKSSIVTSLEANKASKEDLDAMKAELDKIYKTQYETLEKALKEQAAYFKKESEAKGNVFESFSSKVLKALEENKDGIISMTKEGTGVVKFEITKASQSAADIDSGTDFAMMEAGVGQIPTRIPLIREMFRNQNTSSEYIKYNDQETIVRDAKNVAGCAATTHTSKVTWKVRTLQISKVRDFVEVCVDMMDDYDFVEGEVKALVETDVRLQVDSQLLLGDGAYPNLNSIDNVASTFAAGSYASKVQAGTLIDLIQVSACLISDAGQNNAYNANVALVNPVDWCLMKLTKDQNDNYLIPNFVTSDGVNIGSVRVIANNLVPANEMYVMDTSKGTVFSRKGITIEMAFENATNFEKELVTVKAYERLNFRVRNVDANAFLHVPDLAVAITAITTV